MVTAGEARPKWLKPECGVIGLAACELGVVRGPGPVLVRREWMLGVECSDVDDGGCVPGSAVTDRKAVSNGRGELDTGCRGANAGSWGTNGE